MINPSRPEEIFQTGLVDRLEASLRICPDKVLVACGGESLTRAELWELSGRLANGIRAKGVVPGDKVAVLGRNSVWHYLTHWACLRAGVIWAPINPALGPVDLEYTLGDLSPSLSFVAEPQLDLYKASTKTPYVVLGSSSTHGEACMTDVIAEAGSSQPAVWRWRPGDPSYIMYSGGTTGLPKGTILPHALPALTAMKYDRTVQLTPADVIYSCLSMHHAWLFCLLTAGLYADCTVNVASRFSASRWLDEVRECSATVVDPFLPMIAMILKKVPVAENDVDNTVTRCIVGFGSTSEFGRKCRADFERRFGIETFEMYGLTEAPFITEETREHRRPGSTGRGDPFFDVRIVDEDDIPVQSGVVGEIVVRPNLPHQISLGYLNQSDRTVDTWRNLYIHSGDLGYMDVDGFLYFEGRADHFARHNGENVSFSEVEGVLSLHPGVIDCAALAVPSEFGEDDIKICVVAQSDMNPSHVTDWIQDRLASFKVPRYVEFMEMLPRSATKQEVERFKLLSVDPATVWDRQYDRTEEERP